MALAALLAAAAGFLYSQPEAVLRYALESERSRAGLARKEIELPGGIRYVYLEGGRGEPLVLLHGFGANKDNFVRAARFLTPHYRVVIPDHAGFGESSRPDGDYTPAAQVARLRALAKALGLAKVHLGGSSMGGHIALTWAALHPEEVTSLWLLAPGGLQTAPKSELRAMIEKTGRNPLIPLDADEFAQLAEFVMSEPPFVPRPLLDVLARERIRNVALERRIFQQLAGDAVEERVKGLQVPALIAWGTEDRALHVGGAETLRRLMPRSQVVVMTGVGHLPMLERPRQSAEDYLRFRAGPGGTPAPR